MNLINEAIDEIAVKLRGQYLLGFYRKASSINQVLRVQTVASGNRDWGVIVSREIALCPQFAEFAGLKIPNLFGSVSDFRQPEASAGILHHQREVCLELFPKILHDGLPRD
jgi:hypothetical protein